MAILDFRMNNPINTMLASAGGLQQLQANRQSMEAQAAERERMNAFRHGLSNLNTKDAAAVQAFAQQNPEYLEDIQSMVNFGDNMQRQAVGETAIMVDNALRSGDKDRVIEILELNRESIDSLGDPSFTTDSAIEMLNTNPEAFQDMVRGTAMTTLGTEKYLAATQQKRPEPMTEYQELTLADKRENTKLRAMEADLRRQQQAAAAESNDLKRQELEAKVAEKELKVQEQKQKIEQSKKSTEMGKQNLLEAATIAEELLNDPGLDRIVGQVQARLPTLSGESQDVINKANRLQSLLTVDNLKLMSGVLTDRDIAFLTNVASGLNITDSGILGSEKGVRDRLQQIATKIRQGVKGDQQGKQQQPVAPKAGEVMNGYKFIGGDPANPSSWEKQ